MAAEASGLGKRQKMKEEGGRRKEEGRKTREHVEDSGPRKKSKGSKQAKRKRSQKKGAN
jgi:hypothetical protein